MIFYNLTEAEYIALLKKENNGYGGFTYSAAKRMTKGVPADAVGKRPSKSKSTGIGTLVHELLFTPEVLDQKYVFAPSSSITSAVAI